MYSVIVKLPSFIFFFENDSAYRITYASMVFHVVIIFIIAVYLIKDYVMLTYIFVKNILAHCEGEQIIIQY